MKDPLSNNETVNGIIREGKAAAQQGLYERACELFAEAAERSCSEPDILLEVAKGLENIRRYGKAHDILARVLLLVPDLPDAHARMASNCFHLGRPLLAEQHCRKAIETLPGDPNLQFLLGMICASQMKTAQALEAYAGARRLGAEPTVFFYREYATVLEAASRMNELGSLLEEALARFPEDGWLGYLMARYERRQGRVDEALVRLQQVDGSGMAPDNRSRIYFELGRLYDAREDTDKAFASFLQANALQEGVYRMSGVDKEVIRRQVRTMISFDSGELVSAGSTDVMEGRHPVFLVGFPRSGTTLLQQVLQSHPAIDVMEEKPVLFRLKQEIGQTYGDYPACLLSLDEATLQRLRNRYFELSAPYLAKDNPAIVINKLPLSLINLPLIYRLFPQARVIVALRHPCDACLSCFMQHFSPNTAMANFFNLDDTTRFYAEVVGLYTRFRRELPLHFHTVRYEDVVADLESEARRLVAFLGLDWDDAVLDYPHRAAKENIVNTPSYHQVVRPIYTDAVERWRRYERYLAPYKSRLEPLCNEFGYAL